VGGATANPYLIKKKKKKKKKEKESLQHTESSARQD